MTKEVLKAAGALGLSALLLVVFAICVGADIESPTLLSPENGDNLGDNTPVFKWKGPILEGDNKYRLLISKNQDFTTIIYDNGNIPGENNLPENVFSVEIENQLEDGVYYWKVASENTDQTPSENWSKVWTFRIDTLPPASPSLVSPENGENIKDNTPTLIWSNVSENSLPVRYIVEVDNESTFAGCMVLVRENYSATGTSSVDLPELPDNLYYWRVKAYDNAGNWIVSGTRTFRIDTVADSPQNVKVSPSGWAASTSFTVEWVNPPEGSRIDGVYYKIGIPPTSPTDGTLKEESPAGAGINSLTVTVPGDGEHIIYIWLKDNAGNVDHTKRVSVEVYADITPPTTPTISSPSHAQGIPTSNSNPVFSWSAVGGPSPVYYAYMLEGYDDGWKITTSTRVSYSGVPDGTYTFKLQAGELTGLKSGIATYSIVIDTTPPTITLTGLAAEAVETPMGWLLSTSDGTFILTGVVPVGSSVTINGVPVPVSGGSFSQTYTLSVGQNRFVIRVVDEAGNITERILTVEYSGVGVGPGVTEVPSPAVPGFAVFVAALLVLIFVGVTVILRFK